MKRGVEIFCNWADVSAARTLDVLRAAGAVRAIAMVQRAIDSVSALRSRRDAVLSFADRCRAEGIEITLCTGPAVLTHRDRLGCRDRLVRLAEEVGCPPMLDGEPVKIRDSAGNVVRTEHWTRQQFREWIVDGMQLTTTRHEAPYLGEHSMVTYAQFELQSSTKTLSQGLAVFERYTPPECTHVVIGTFDEKDNPRTLDELRTDLDRAARQAQLSGRLAVWVAQTTSAAECEALRSWAERTWP